MALDEFRFSAPAVFDKLIHSGEMPVTIGIAVEHGTVPGQAAPGNPRFNRSFEFDSLDDTLGRFLLQELFPAVEQRRTPDGLPIRLSRDANDRAVGGASTGAIAAFTLAWERPNEFRRVFSAIGTYVGMRGGDRYPVLIRKTEPKPIRIFLQDGSRDGLPNLLDEVGDWWMSNLTMERALTFSGYEVQHSWGDGPHDVEHATTVFPDAMRWLWKGWPKPVLAGESGSRMLKDILVPAENWTAITKTDAEATRLLDRSLNFVARDVKGREYSTNAGSGELILRQLNGKLTRLDKDLKAPTGVVISPDGAWLSVAESRSHWGFQYQLQEDASIKHKQKFYWFHVPEDADDSGAGPWAADREGRLYSATRMGVQVFDRNGRSRAILAVPSDGEVTALAFGGPALDTLYVRCADGTMYRRKFKVPALPPGSAPIQLPPWTAG